MIILCGMSDSMITTPVFEYTMLKHARIEPFFHTFYSCLLDMNLQAHQNVEY